MIAPVSKASRQMLDMYRVRVPGAKTVPFKWAYRALMQVFGDRPLVVTMMKVLIVDGPVVV